MRWEVRGQAQSVLNGIDPRFFNDKSRFGGAHYTADDAVTTIAELASHDIIGTHTIRYSFDKGATSILDLTNPSVAKEWGYFGGKITQQTIDIGQWIMGYNVIKFGSERGPGSNYAIFGDFDNILTPEMIVTCKMKIVCLLKQCNKCSGEFKVPVVSDFSYGCFILCSSDGLEFAYLEAFSDAAFDEISDMVYSHHFLKNKNKRERASYMQSTYTIACDLSPNGKTFHIGVRKNSRTCPCERCPSCSSSDLETIEGPSREYKMEVPDVTHEQWDKKSKEEKVNAIDLFIKQEFT